MRLKSLPFVMMLVVCIWSLPDPQALAAPGAQPFPPQGGAETARIRNVLNSRVKPVLDDGAKGLQSRRLAGEKAPSTLNALVLMCDFSDSLMLGRYGQVPGDFPPPMQTDRYYAAHDSVFFQHLMGDVADYFDKVSGGRLTVNTTIHPRTVNLPEPMGYYGNHPEFGDQHIRLADAVVDSLDNPEDGIVFPDFDTIILVHAGAGEETDILGNSPEQIFSTYLDPDDFAAAQLDSILDTPYIPATGYAPGTGIDRVLVLPETEQQDPVGIFNGGFGSLGVYCFEVGLHLGMLSLSDFTPPGRVDSQGIGQFGLMGYGLFVGLGFIPPHPCAFNKVLMGWLDPYEADLASPGPWQLTPSERPADSTACARVSITGQEYWLLEYRNQDPNGDRRFTFSGDLNGNGLPDFYDADSANGDGTPTGKLDPETDIRERVTDAEWDFSMSENNARRPREECLPGQPDQICDPGALAAGSGVYIWHIDEGVIQDVFNAPGNLFNADPTRKAVDLEEADQIQDLDSREPSDFMLGGDDDSFRGEGAMVFDAGTLPPTDTAGGAYTGIAFRDFSNVVLDSMSYTVVLDTTTHWGYEYADTVTFSLSLDQDSAQGPVLSARRDFPAGTDLTGSHVLIASLESGGANDQIVLAGNQGEVFVLDGDLNEFLDHDSDPSTLEPFVTGMRGGEPVAWNLPPAVGDIDHDGEADIILTGPAGVYAFKADAGGVRDVEPGAVGLYQDLPSCALPPILLPFDFSATGDEALYVSVCAVDVDAGQTSVRLFSGADATVGPVFHLGPVLVRSAPVLAGEFLLTAITDTIGGAYHRLTVLDLTPSLVPEIPVRLDVPLTVEPGPFPVSWGIVSGSTAEDPVYYAIVSDNFGHGETVYFDSTLARVRDNVVWDQEVQLESPLAVGGAFVSEGVFGRVGQAGDWFDGWPRRPREDVSAVPVDGAGSPLVVELVDAGLNLDQYIFPTLDGRLYGFGTMGESVPGWPLGGPARSAGSPAVGDLTGEALLDLVAVGSFPRITGVDTDLATEYVSSVSIWPDVAMTDPVWPMAGGSPWRNGSYDAFDWVTLPISSEGTGLVDGSHHCYPSPLLSGPLKVRGLVRAPARARVFVYNLEGEEIEATSWQDVAASEPFTIEVALDGRVTGMYLCRLVVENQGGGTDHSVVQFAVVR